MAHDPVDFAKGEDPEVERGACLPQGSTRGKRSWDPNPGLTRHSTLPGESSAQDLFPYLPNPSLPLGSELGLQPLPLPLAGPQGPHTLSPKRRPWGRNKDAAGGSRIGPRALLSLPPRRQPASPAHSLVAHVAPAQLLRVVVLHVLGLLLARGWSAADAARRVRHHDVADGLSQPLAALGRQGFPLSAGHDGAAVFLSRPEAQEGEEGPGEQRAAARHGRQDARRCLGCAAGPGPLSAGTRWGRWAGGSPAGKVLPHAWEGLFLLWRRPNRMWYGQAWAG